VACQMHGSLSRQTTRTPPLSAVPQPIFSMMRRSISVCSSGGISTDVSSGFGSTRRVVLLPFASRTNCPLSSRTYCTPLPAWANRSVGCDCPAQAVWSGHFRVSKATEEPSLATRPIMGRVR